jgi:ubiquinol-cytochrome c reductase iron-sulfur subunit
MSDVGAIAASPDVVDESRRKFLITATSLTAGVGVVLTAVPFVASWQPSERAKALGAPVPLDIEKLEVGQMITTTWQKKAIYVVRRTQDMVDKLPAHDGDLKDPNSESSSQPDYAKNKMRSRRVDVLVLIGNCTHLGCLPKQHFMAGDSTPGLGATWPGGWLCPCHGSRFDLAGRVFKGSPASVNLIVPPYSFPSQVALLIGADSAQGAA